MARTSVDPRMEIGCLCGRTGRYFDTEEALDDGWFTHTVTQNNGPMNWVARYVDGVEPTAPAIEPISFGFMCPTCVGAFPEEDQ